MKKRMTFLFLTVCMVLGCMACGGKKSITVVEIEGKKYDLKEDIQDVIGEMVDNDLLVVHPQNMRSYDNDGRFARQALSMDVSNGIVCAFENCENVSKIAKNDVIHSQFIVGFKGEGSFTTANGITEESDDDDLKALEGFVHIGGLLDRNDDSYVAIYADGELVDWEEYEDDFEDFIETCEEKGFAEAVNKFFPGREHVPSIATCVAANQNVAHDYHEEWENEVRIALVAWDMGEELVDGDIDFYTIVTYDNSRDNISVYYDFYYIDKKWDIKKFMAQ